jgi:hypothetical protein
MPRTPSPFPGTRSADRVHFYFAWGCFRDFESPGTNPHLPCSPGMKIREENCNMFLLAVVTVFTVIVAASSSLVTAPDKAPVRYAARAEQAPGSDKPIAYVTDQPAVRVVGAPFVPNTNPRQR